MASTDAPRAFDSRAGMGINPDMLKMSMKVMKANPNVIKMAQEQMAKMSPEQMKQASDLAQKQMEAMALQMAAMQAQLAAAHSAPTPETDSTWEQPETALALEDAPRAAPMPAASAL